MAGSAGGRYRVRSYRAARMDGRPQVLFVCRHNAGRSQMAAALLDRVVVDIAGRTQVR